MASDITAAPEPRTDLKVWLAVVGSIIGAFIAVLNIQITNASLPDIQGAIGAGMDDGGWISTAYLVAEIVVIPLTGFLTSGVLAAALSAGEHRAVPGDVGRLRICRQPAADDRSARPPGVFRRRADTPRLHHHADHAAALEAAGRHGDVHAVGDIRSRDRADDRRVPHRDLWLAVHLLREPGPRRDHARGADAVIAAGADAARDAAAWRLAWHRHAGDRARLAADGSRGRQQGRLVRLADDRAAVRGLRHRARAVHLDRADRGTAAAQSAPAAAPQLRAWQHRQCHRRHGAVWIGVSRCPATCRRCRVTMRSRSARCWPRRPCHSSC